VTVLSRGEGVDSVKIVVSRAELELIAAGVTLRQCGGAAAAANRHRHVAPPPTASESMRVDQRLRNPLLRRQGGVAERRGPWRPALSGIPEEA
jgi:hypothetical protein